MTDAAAFVWVLGNHDPAPPEGLAGDRRVGMAGRAAAVPARGGGRRRERRDLGHYHPKAQVAVRGALVSRPCFITDQRRLILPAMGAYTGGLDVRDPAIARLFPRGGRVFLLGRERLFSFGYGAGRGGPESSA